MTCAISWASSRLPEGDCGAKRFAPNTMSLPNVYAFACIAAALSCAAPSLWMRTSEKSAPKRFSNSSRVSRDKGTPPPSIALTA